MNKRDARAIALFAAHRVVDDLMRNGTVGDQWWPNLTRDDLDKIERELDRIAQRLFDRANDLGYDIDGWYDGLLPDRREFL